MSEQVQKVPFGYEPPTESRKGTLIFYDTFDTVFEEELDEARQAAVHRSFAKLVLYPLHEQTVKRMFGEPVKPYYKREDRLHDWRRHSGSEMVSVEGWEGKRKKYTPIDAALRHLVQHYPAPYFLLLQPRTANVFASFDVFPEWITKLRLLLTREPDELHPRLEQYRGRWDTLDTSS
ncbi:hypothetical protein [Paenibacillus tarimensis]|uniref:hypothetical protein n=1 Tax=Paenibacillus tarimensis TaxID=416012 RepID=UPI001F425877|nr:hypothetical protein [Paenibacillus tarimensis]MCF2944610.1 hypothetical protein [Paenibacillus tarimensis]